MERKIVWTERSSGDVEVIVRYIARRDPNAASRIGGGIYNRVQIPKQNPLNPICIGWKRKSGSLWGRTERKYNHSCQMLRRGLHYPQLSM
jgi:hypothetical protein